MIWEIYIVFFTEAGCRNVHFVEFYQEKHVSEGLAAREEQIVSAITTSERLSRWTGFEITLIAQFSPKIEIAFDFTEKIRLKNFRNKKKILKLGLKNFKTSKFDSNLPLVIVKLGVDFRKTVLPAVILKFYLQTPNFTKLLNP